MPDVENIFLIEPNPFASRLHVLAPLAWGSREYSTDVRLHIPPRESGVDWEEFLAQLPVGVKILQSGENRVARPRQRVGHRRLLALLREALKAQGRGANTIVFTAVDDYPLALIWIAAFLRTFQRGARVFFVRYRVDDFPEVSSSRNLRQMVKRLYFALVTSLASAHTIVFDERIPSRHDRSIMPDPWSGKFGQASRLDARMSLEWENSGTYVGLIGYQDERKGFPTAVRLLVEAKRRNEALKAVIVGRVDSAFDSELLMLEEIFGSDLIHWRDYLEDDHLALILAALNAVVLPYAQSFTASSGVLIRCAASRTPVLATDHGLVAWRVEHYGLGAVFSATAIEPAVPILLELAERHDFPPEAMDFVSGSSFGAFALRFADALASSRGH